MMGTSVAIRSGKPGDIVYCANGYGSKAEIIERLDDLWTKVFGRIYYRVKILESAHSLLPVGTEVDQPGRSLTRQPRGLHGAS